MMKLKIIQAGEQPLRQQARALTIAEIKSPAIQELIELMRVTMHDAPGVGLAAPQIGLPLQLAVIEDRSVSLQKISEDALTKRERAAVPFQVIINPKLILTAEPTINFFEGCLSVAGFTAIVPRARTVKVECLNEQAESVVVNASGWYARILQHEIDHLNGVLYLDRMHSRSFMTTENHARFWGDKEIDETMAALNIARPSID